MASKRNVQSSVKQLDDDVSTTILSVLGFAVSISGCFFLRKSGAIKSLQVNDLSLGTKGQFPS
jgi:hypothetical protein